MPAQTLLLASISIKTIGSFSLGLEPVLTPWDKVVGKLVSSTHTAPLSVLVMWLWVKNYHTPSVRLTAAVAINTRQTRNYLIEEFILKVMMRIQHDQARQSVGLSIRSPTMTLTTIPSTDYSYIRYGGKATMRSGRWNGRMKVDLQFCSHPTREVGGGEDNSVW